MLRHQHEGVRVRQADGRRELVQADAGVRLADQLGGVAANSIWNITFELSPIFIESAFLVLSLPLAAKLLFLYKKEQFVYNEATLFVAQLSEQVQEYMMMTGASLYGIEQQLLFHTSQSH